MSVVIGEGVMRGCRDISTRRSRKPGAVVYDLYEKKYDIPVIEVYLITEE